MDEIAGPIKRFLAILADSCLAIFAFSFLLSFDFVTGLIDDICGISELTNLLSMPIAFLLILVFVRLIMTLIFGVSLGQMIMGIHGTGNFLWKRIGGVIRCLLEPFDIASLFITSLPVVIHRRSLKEFISITALRSTGGFFYLFLCIVFIPILFSMSIVSPLLTDFDNAMKLDVSEIKVQNVKLAATADFAAIKTYRSNIFSFLTLFNLKNSKMDIVPSWDIFKSNDVDIVRPTFYIYNEESKISFQMRALDQLDLRDVLDSSQKFNPLFYMRYPELALVLAKDKTLFDIKDYKSEFGSNLILEEKPAFQLEDLLESNLGLNFHNVSEYAMNRGIFLKSAVDLRTKVLSIFSDVGVDKIYKLRLGSQSFFILRGLSNADNRLNMVMFSGNTLHPVPFLFVGDVNDESKILDFVKNFFGSASWYFDYRNVFDLQNTENELDLFLALEIINAYPNDNVSLKYVYNELYNLAKLAINTGDITLNGSVVKALNRFVLWYNLKEKNSAVEPSFLTKIQALKFSLKEGKL